MTTRTFRHRATGDVVTKYPNQDFYVYQVSGHTEWNWPAKFIENSNDWEDTARQYLLTPDLTFEGRLDEPVITISNGAKFKLEGDLSYHVINDNGKFRMVPEVQEQKFTVVENIPVQWQAGMWGWCEESQFIFRVNKVMDDFMGNVTIDESWSYKSNSAISQRWKLLIIPGDSTPATPEQIKKYLVEELNRRGYGKIGMSITPMGVDYGTFGDYTTVGICYLSEFDTLLLNGIAIYQRGQWAKIVKDEPEKNKPVRFVENTWPIENPFINISSGELNFIQNYGTVMAFPDGTHYLYLPYWIEVIDGKCKMISFEKLPERVKEEIKSRREPIEPAQPDNNNVDNETYWKCVRDDAHFFELGEIYLGSFQGFPGSGLECIKDCAKRWPIYWLQVTREEYEAQERKATPINSQVEEIKKAVWAIGIHESMYKSCKIFIEWYEENIGKKTDTTPGNNS